MDADWEARLASVWASIDDYPDEAQFRSRIDQLTTELPLNDPVGWYERGGAFDSTGHPAEAVALYREALALGLTGPRRRQCVIQLASSLRNLGEPLRSVELLSEELTADSDDLDDAVRGFLALALADCGREREALGHALSALARHLSRYQRSLTAYAAELS